jgi:hypothetical protein
VKALASPEITFVTTSMGEPQKLAATLSSVQSQVGCAVESVVVESGYSLDPFVGELARSLGSNVLMGVGGGPYAAMNAGLSVARGDGVCFLNSGDFLVSNFSATRLLNLLDQHEWGVGGTALVNDKGDIIKLVCPPISRWRWRLGLAFVPHPSTVARRSLLVSMGGFDVNLGVAADQGLAMKLQSVQSPAWTQEVLAALVLGGMSSARTGWSVARDFQRCRTSANWSYGAVPLLDGAATLASATVRSLAPVLRLPHLQTRSGGRST